MNSKEILTFLNDHHVVKTDEHHLVDLKDGVQISGYFNAIEANTMNSNVWSFTRFKSEKIEIQGNDIIKLQKLKNK